MFAPVTVVGRKLILVHTFFISLALLPFCLELLLYLQILAVVNGYFLALGEYLPLN